MTEEQQNILTSRKMQSLRKNIYRRTSKKLPAMGKQCKNCNKPNHFARTCRSQQVNEIAEKTESSEEEFNLVQIFDSCDESEVFSIESKVTKLRA